MNKIILSAFLCFFSFWGIAQTSDSLISFEPTEKENSLLWEISGNGLTSNSWLFGTIHMIPEGDFFLTEPIENAFQESEKVVFEIDTDDMFNMTSQLSLIMKSFMNGGVKLQDLLNEEDYKLVKNHFDEIGLPLMLFGRVKPMILSIFASEDFGNPTEGMDMKSIKSYEIEFSEMAKKGEKPIDGLETVQYQMSMFDSIPYKDQAEMLVQTLKGEKVAEDNFDEMVELYKNQDLIGLQKLIAGGGDDFMAKYDDILLVNRNKNWIEPMKEHMDKQKTFFAVGAGHLPGKNGVISLLRMEGYKVSPVK